MSTQFKSVVANRLANLGWNIDAVLRLCRWPQIYSIAVNVPNVDGIELALYDSQKRFLPFSTFNADANNGTNDNYVFRVPKGVELRLGFIKVENNISNSEIPNLRTNVSVVYLDGTINKFTLEQHPQVRQLATSGSYQISSYYAPICAKGLFAPDIIDTKPLS